MKKDIQESCWTKLYTLLAPLIWPLEKQPNLKMNHMIHTGRLFTVYKEEKILNKIAAITVAINSLLMCHLRRMKTQSRLQSSTYQNFALLHVAHLT